MPYSVSLGLVGSCKNEKWWNGALNSHYKAPSLHFSFLQLPTSYSVSLGLVGSCKNEKWREGAL